jgi:hypothetical protein
VAVGIKITKLACVIYLNPYKELRNHPPPPVNKPTLQGFKSDSAHRDHSSALRLENNSTPHESKLLVSVYSDAFKLLVVSL